MPSSDLRARLAACGLAVALAALLAAGAAGAQTQPLPQAQGFAVERFYPSAPGGGWLVMDDLDVHGALGGAMGMTTSYAYRPLVVDEGPRRLAAVDHEAFTDFAFAATYDRWRFHLGFDMPLVIEGYDGVAGGYRFTAPTVDPSPNTDTLGDLRIGVDGRLLGGPTDAFRLGAGAQIFLPEGKREDYDTDGTVRAMVRLLAAGDVGLLTYAAQAGVHVRPLDDGAVPGSPRGSELLFGAAAGLRASLDAATDSVFILGPEVYGETALRSPFAGGATGVEGILSTRYEHALSDKSLLLLRLGTGPGIDPQFGAPAWRVLFGVELSADVHSLEKR